MRHDLPTGTVTFLFTDVEGSTRLLQELGAQEYADALGRHRDVIRAALVAHRGVEVDTQGDAFFCAFDSAAGAMSCAADIQLALAETPIRVRMGVHTGEALVAGDHYVGMDVHRAARIGACGHGGQVVVSPSTVALLEPGSFALRDLGQHRLKDLSAPVRLHQLGDGEFGALKTLFRTNLPIPATPFLGREDELGALAERASEPGVRLLTLVGPGGTGKTRLALQLAAELADGFPDGVFWVPLASVRDPSLVASAAAQVLAVDERAGEELVDAVPRAVGEKRLALLLDNCEHVLDDVAKLVSGILGSAPAVLVLTTSRQPLGLGGENVFVVDPLLPNDAVSLFEARARAAGAAVGGAEARAAIEQLCARLDNLPLAVELAAARTAALPPAALLERVSSRIDVLAGPRDADERQRTLRATIAWSHDLLGDAERALFRRLAVFRGGARLDDVEDVCECDLSEVVSLVAQSLLRQSETTGEPRYWMLETIREFAEDALEESGEGDSVRDRHLGCFANLAREARDRLIDNESTKSYGRLERDLENLRAAFSWALDANPVAGDDYAEAAIALANALAPLHLLHGRYAEAEDVIRKALALGPRPMDEVVLRRRLGRGLRQRGRPAEGLASHVEAERLLERLEPKDETWWRAWLDVKLEQAHHHYYEGELDALEEVVEELRPRVEQYGTPFQQLEFLHALAQNAFRRERYVLSEETEGLMRELHRRGVALGEQDVDFTLGFALLWRGRLAEAAARLAEGLVSARSRGDALIEARCLVYQVVAYRLQADVEGARELLEEIAKLDELHGYDGLVEANRAWLAFRDRDLDEAVAAAERAFADWGDGPRPRPTVFQWTARFPMVGVELARGRSDAAFEHARAMLEPSQQPLPPELHHLVERAISDADAALLERALEAGARTGYA